MKSSSGFSWFEVLIAIIVLAILAAFLFPTVKIGLGSHPRASAKNDVVQIATAIHAFETEYGLLPSTNSAAQDVNGPLLQALVGSNTTLNPRGLVFLEIMPAKKGKGGLSGGTFVDPWGGPYKVKFDTDYDTRIQNVGPTGNLTPEITEKAAVWNDPSSHPNRSNEGKKKKRFVASWE